MNLMYVDNALWEAREIEPTAAEDIVLHQYKAYSNVEIIQEA
ncbi:MAG: hypothetical protein P8098_18695 [Candidatus Thiodiazotropha sp.]